MAGKIPDEQKHVARAALRIHMDVIYAMAEDIGKRHLEFVMAENAKRAWGEKSVLYVKPRLRHNTLAVTWYVVSWYGSKALKTRRMVKKVIVKPKNKYGYTMDTLLKQARAWEVAMVSEVENALIPIRREASFIAGALSKLNQVLEVERAGDSE